MKMTRNQSELLTAKSFSEAKNLDEFKEELRKIDNLNTSKIDGKTVLHIVSAAGKIDFVKYLIEIKKADINAKAYNGGTALHLAAMYGHVNMVELLLEKGAKIEAKDNGGDTALHYAADYGHLNVVKCLR